MTRRGGSKTTPSPLLVLMVTYVVEKPTTPILACIDQLLAITLTNCPLSLLDLHVKNVTGMTKYTRCDRGVTIPLERKQCGRSRCRMVGVTRLRTLLVVDANRRTSHEPACHKRTYVKVRVCTHSDSTSHISRGTQTPNIKILNTYSRPHGPMLFVRSLQNV